MTIVCRADASEIVDGVYIDDVHASVDTEFIKKHGTGLIINCAKGLQNALNGMLNF